MMNTNLIKLFNVALVENTFSSDEEKVRNFKEMNKLAARVGYFVHPNVCNASVKRFLQEQDINVNATFYKEWEDVLSKTRLELALDQVLHYMTTYGTEFALGNGYVPNEGAENVPEINFKHYKTIMPVTRDELFTLCWDMLCSGIALKEETMVTCADFVIEVIENAKNDRKINVDEIKNREAQIYICTKLNMWPTQPLNLFRMIIFLTTKSTLIVNNNATISNIMHSTRPFDFTQLDEKTLVSLSSIFLRFKNLFLAFKHNAYCSKNAAVINKLRRLAVKNHKPMTPGFWQTVLTEAKSMDDVKAHLSEITNYKKVSLMQACLERISNSKNKIYIIRNGKMFFKSNAKSLNNVEIVYFVDLYNTLRDSLVEALSKVAYNETTTIIEGENGTQIEKTTYIPKTVKVYSGLKVTMPASEKSFIGNYPFGTSYELTHDNFICCYWRNEWGTRDYDLSLIDMRGNKIGWNASYYGHNNGIVYSGDMTNAEPEAAEVIKMSKIDNNFKALIKVNQYNGNNKSKFEMAFGQTDVNFNGNYSRRGYMVNPNDIKFKATIEHENKSELQVGLVGDNKITLMEIHSGSGIVSRARGYEAELMETFVDKTRFFVNAEDILKAAGFQIINENSALEADIDFANLDKNTLISLMA